MGEGEEYYSKIPRIYRTVYVHQGLCRNFRSNELQLLYDSSYYYM